MTLDQLKAFLAKVKDDSNLREKLKAAKSPEDVVGIAKEHGHEFTADNFSQLSEEELDGVAGGGYFSLACCAGSYIRDNRTAIPGTIERSKY